MWNCNVNFSFCFVEMEEDDKASNNYNENLIEKLLEQFKPCIDDM